MSLVRFRPEAPFADVAHLVERHLAKVEVAGSSPVIRSIFFGILPGSKMPRHRATVRWTVVTAADQGAQFAPRIEPRHPLYKVPLFNGTRAFPQIVSSADVAHPVERHLPKVDVAGSSPVIRSKKSALF